MTTTQRPASDSGSMVPGAIRSALMAGVIAGIVRIVFCLTVEKATMVTALGLGLAFFVGTAVLVFAGIMIIGSLVRRRA